jgi:murein peptide amidase A
MAVHVTIRLVSIDSIRMASESNAAEALLGRIERLGWPEIGRSSLGRPIRGARLPGNPGAGAPPLILVGGVHGDEPASVEATLELAEVWPALAPAAVPVWVVPALNPDGLAAGRKNSARDVDLNRNFPARNFSTEHRPGYHPGEGPASEPETEALVRLVQTSRPWGVVAVHAPFACINYDGPARAWAEAAAAACGWPARADIGYPTPGSLGSWLGVDSGLPVLTVELPPGPFAAFREPALRALSAAVAWRPTTASPQ